MSTAKRRFEASEAMRFCAWSFVYTAQNISDAERRLWLHVLKELDVLAEYWKAKGKTVTELGQ